MGDGGPDLRAGVREDGIVEGRIIETHYRPAERMGLGDGFLYVVIDGGPVDFETRIPFYALEKMGFRRAGEAEGG